VCGNARKRGLVFAFAWFRAKARTHGPTRCDSLASEKRVCRATLRNTVEGCAVVWTQCNGQTAQNSTRCGGAGFTRRCYHQPCARRRSALPKPRHAVLCDTKNHRSDDRSHPKQNAKPSGSSKRTRSELGVKHARTAGGSVPTKPEKREKWRNERKRNDRTKVALRGNNTTTSKPEEDFCCGVAMMGIPCAVMVLF